MDQKAFIKQLHQIFCDTNKKDRKYSAVWLSDVDLGGMYYTDKYVLNVKAEHQIDNCNEEIIAILEVLDEKAKEELKYIWRVVVYNANEEWHCHSEDLMVYTEQDAC